ncbi:unnamed protein product [Caenorhabditis brenneri]
MAATNVFTDKSMILNSITVGGAFTNHAVSSSTHGPKTFGCQLVDLPRVAFEEFWKSISISEQISLTIFDETIRERIESWKKLETPKIDVVLGSAMIRITLSYKGCEGEVYLVQEDLKTSGTGPYGAVYGKKGDGENIRTFSGCKPQFTRAGEVVQNMLACPQPYNDVQFFVEHLETVFSGKLNVVCIDKTYWPQCSNINRKLRNCAKLIMPSTIANETFNQFAEDFRAPHLVSRADQMTGFRPTQIISKDTYDDSGYSIQVKDLELIDCRVISFCASCFKAAQFNQVVKNWIEGKYEKMEVMIFWVNSWDLIGQYEPLNNPEEVLDSIETFEVGNVSMETILDNIETSVKVRRADGRMAVVTTEGVQNDRPFHFRMIALKSDDHVPQFDISEEFIPIFDWPTKVNTGY